MNIGRLGTAEPIVILLIIIMLFGATRIPALDAALDSIVGQFK